MRYAGATNYVLIVDDDPVTLRYCHEILAASGEDYQVALESSPLEALNRVTRGEVDLLVADILMPKMNGFALLKALRREESQQIPVIMLSGKRDREAVAEAVHLGANDYVCKPVDPEIFMAKVRSLLKDRLAGSVSEFASASLGAQAEVELPPVSATLLRLTEAGVALRMRKPLEPGALIRVRCPIFREVGIEPDACRVDRCEKLENKGDAAYEVIADFVGLGEDSRCRLRRWILNRAPPKG